MSAPFENQEGYELPDKVERIDTDEIQQNNNVSTDPESIGECSESFRESLFQSVSGVPHSHDSRQATDHMSTLFNSTIAPPTPRRVQTYSFAELETNLTNDRDRAITVPEQKTDSPTDNNSLINSNILTGSTVLQDITRPTDNAGKDNISKLADSTDDNHKGINTTDNTGEDNISKLADSTDDNHKDINTTDNTGKDNISKPADSTDDNHKGINTTDNTGKDNISKPADSTDDNHKGINTTDNTGEDNISKLADSTDDNHKDINTTDNTGKDNISKLADSTDDNHKGISTTDNAGDKHINITTSDIENSREMGGRALACPDIVFDNVDISKALSEVSDLSPTLKPAPIRYTDIPSIIPEITHTEPELQVQREPILHNEASGLFSQFISQPVEGTNTAPNNNDTSLPVEPMTGKPDTHIEHQHSTQNTSGSLSQIEIELPIESGLQSIYQTGHESLVQKVPVLSTPIEPEQATTSRLESISQNETEPLIQKATKLSSPTEPEQTIASKLESMSQTEIEPFVQKAPKSPPSIASSQLELEATTQVEPKADAQSKFQPFSHSGHELATELEPTPSSYNDVVTIRDSPEPSEKPLKKKDPRGRKPKTVTNQSGPSSRSKPAKKISAQVADPIEVLTVTSAPIKKSKRQADKQAALKASEEEAERKAIAASVRLVEEQIAAEISQQAEIAQQAELSQLANFSQLAESTQPIDNSQQAAVKAADEENAVKIQDVIELSDTETVPAPKKSTKKAALKKTPVKKTSVKKTKNNTVKPSAVTQDNPMGQTFTADTMLGPIPNKCTIRNITKQDLIEDPGTIEGDVRSQDTKPEPNASHSGRKRRATTTAVSYKDSDAEYSEDEVPRSKREKKPAVKAKEVLASSSKPVKEAIKSVISRPKRISAKAKVTEETNSADPIYIDTDDEVNETEIAQAKTSKKEVLSDEKEKKLQMLIQSRESKLTEVDFRDLIPSWLRDLSEKDKQELAVLLPQPDQVVKNKHIGIRPDFGRVATNHFYEAADKWQDILFLGGFKPKKEVVVDNVEEDPFKDENYEEHWGDRITKFKAEKRKSEGVERKMPRSKKAKGKATAIKS